MSRDCCPNCGLFMRLPRDHTCPERWWVWCESEGDGPPSETSVVFYATYPEEAARAWVDKLMAYDASSFIGVGEGNHVEVFVAPVSNPMEVKKVWVWLELAVRTQVVD